MRASLEDQKKLLELAEIDLSLLRLRIEFEKIENSNELTNLREESLRVSELLADSRNSVADAELKLHRSESDLELAEKRLAQDVSRLASAKNQKDAEGLQHEIDSLKQRISDLEDSEIEILEELEVTKLAHEQLLIKKK